MVTAQKRKNLTPRTKILRIVMWAIVFVIIGRLFVIQIIDHDEYVAKAAKQHTMQNTIVAKRGEIYMMDGDEPVPVVLNSKVWSVYIDPKTTDRAEIEKALNEDAKDYITGDFNQIYSISGLRYAIVAKNVPYEAAQKLKNRGITGVGFQGSNKRVYPEGTMASGLLGFVNADGEGQYGVEGSLNKELAGENGLLKTVKDINNIPLTIGNENVKVPAKDGKNVVLSIDRNIQYKAEQVLAEKTKEFGVSHAAAIVMDPSNGEILAMAATPNYDASNYSSVTDASVFQTDALMDAYEPASVCKTFAFSAAIDMGKMTPNTTYYNSDQTIVDGWPINNATKGHTGNITMQTALDWSLNTGSVQSLRLLGDSTTEITQVGKKRLYDYYYNKFNLGKPTGIELVENSGIIISPDDADGTNARYANMTFGQGLNITLMQLAAAYASVVNGGEYFRPTIITGEMKDGKFDAYDYNETDHPTISSETSKTMRQMLVKTRNNFRNAKTYDHGLYVGGKTGTAQRVRDGKYVMDETTGTYAGFGAESEDATPKYLIVTKIWEDGRTMDGGTNAKPIFDEISEFMIDYLRMQRKE